MTCPNCGSTDRDEARKMCNNCGCPDEVVARGPRALETWIKRQAGVRFSFTQPICELCWNERHPNREAHKMKPLGIRLEVCAFCGNDTEDGIYIREDPKHLAYATLQK